MSSSDKRTILLVEDGVIIGIALIQQLKKYGYEIVHLVQGLMIQRKARI
jgi:hypothetical protein